MNYIKIQKKQVYDFFLLILCDSMVTRLPPSESVCVSKKKKKIDKTMAVKK
jgi:hypothetical protein